MNTESLSDRKSVIIYGATSQIGSVFATKLLNRGDYNVVAFARNPAKAEYLRQKGAEVVIGDITNPSSVFEAIGDRKVFATVNFAADFNQSADPRQSRPVNVTAEEYVLMASEEFHVPRHIFISTIGTLMEGPNAYKDTKLEAEKLVRDSLVPEWLILRYANVLGTDIWNKPFRKVFEVFGKRVGPTFIPSDKRPPFPYLGIETAAEAVLKSLTARSKQTIYVLDGFVEMGKYLEDIGRMNNIDIPVAFPGIAAYNLLRSLNWIASRRGMYFPLTPGMIKILIHMPREIENQTMIRELGITPQSFAEVIESVRLQLKNVLQ